MTYDNKFNKILVGILLVCFVFQQIGFSYHLSFGTLGILVAIFFSRRQIKGRWIAESLIISAFVLVSYLWVVAKYGYTEGGLRVLRFAVCALFLLLLARKQVVIGRLNYVWLVFAIAVATIPAWIQIFVTKSFQVPLKYFAVGENLGLADSAFLYDFYANTLRANGIYSEPSYLGMVLCCLYSFVWFKKSIFRDVLIAYLWVTQLLVGSLLGVVGMVMLSLVFLWETRSEINIKILFSIFAVVLVGVFVALFLNENYDFDVYNRVFSSDGQDDVSMQARILYPLILIYENMVNGDIFGIPINEFEHFLYTGLYTDYSSFPGHNGFLALITQNGFVGIFIVFIIVKRVRNLIELLLLVLIGSQSGNFLSYEKVFTMVFVLTVFRSVYGDYVYGKKPESINGVNDIYSRRNITIGV
jgi:hypothetical protein